MLSATITLRLMLRQLLSFSRLQRPAVVAMERA
ncbi:MAG: hypothetical protein K0S45_2960, partial [Nitrospira sp.]|nr:hypothetical protein [Nitrospira sp.]